MKLAINTIVFFFAKTKRAFMSCMHARLESIEFLSTSKITNISMMATCTVRGN